jgi:2-oxoisovalerate dehydrogenase E1 component alpha subunit
MEGCAVGLVRVLDQKHEAVGPWNPRLEDEDLQVGLRHMLLTRIFDDPHAAHPAPGKDLLLHALLRRGGGRGGAGHGAAAGDMLFPSYRQQGIYMVRGKPLVELMCQLLSNTRDMCKGRQLPVMYHWSAGRIFSISGNLTTQFPQAVGWAMAAAIRNEDHIACTWIGEGASAEADFHPRACCSPRLPGAGDHEHRQQPVGHLHRSRVRRAASSVRSRRAGRAMASAGHPRRRQ